MANSCIWRFLDSEIRSQPCDFSVTVRSSPTVNPASSASVIAVTTCRFAQAMSSAPFRAITAAECSACAAPRTATRSPNVWSAAASAAVPSHKVPPGRSMPLWMVVNWPPMSVRSLSSAPRRFGDASLPTPRSATGSGCWRRAAKLASDLHSGADRLAGGAVGRRVLARRRAVCHPSRWPDLKSSRPRPVPVRCRALWPRC